MLGMVLNEPSIVKLPDYLLPDAFRGEIDGKGLEEGATIDNMDPSRPFLVLKIFDWDKVDEWIALKSAWIAKQLPNDIIIPDPVPQIGRDAFFKIAPQLKIVLQKDSVRCFLPLFVQCESIMTYQCAITSETLTYMVRHDALRCAKVVLEGKAPELCSKHANPNCMNPYGYFALHEAAERFSPDMIKLLFRHGASANVRTSSDAAIQGLLPLHVAVENACMHKYLEDNLSPMQYHEDYIYKLIHLLCLPEMKVFLDTIILLAEKTDNLVDELWNYMKNGKLVQTAVLLLAAQKHIRKIKPDGFCIITHHLFKEYASLRCAKGDVSHVEVLARVSSILKEFGFCPKEKYIDNINLSPYIHGMSYCDIFHKDATKAVAQMSSLLAGSAVEKKAVSKKARRGWDPTYMRRSFSPYWRSVLSDNAEEAAHDKPVGNFGQLHNSKINESSIPTHNIGFLGGIQQLTGTLQSRRYSTAAFKMLIKVLKNA